MEKEIIQKANENGKMQLNVGGCIFQCSSKTLRTFPDTVLANLNETAEQFDTDTKEYFFDRNPDVFKYILDAYRTGVLHLPNDTHVCGYNFKDELSYWGLNTGHVSPCCWETLYKAENDVSTIRDLTENINVYKKEDVLKLTNRQKLWIFLDDPKSSRYAFIWGIFITMTILVSSAYTIATTMEIFYTDDLTDGEKAFIVDWLKRSGLSPAGNGTSTSQKLMGQRQSPGLMYINIACFIILTIENILSVICCPNKNNLYTSWMRISEFVCIISFWISYALQMNMATLQSDLAYHAFTVFSFLTMFKLVILLRATRHYRVFFIMMLTFRTSKSEIKVLLVILCLLCTFFRVLMYTAEFFHTDVFDNAFSAMYWSLITLTTVGYGDYVPATAFGHVVAALCAVMGVLVLALPVGVIASKFNTLYSHHKYISQHLKANPRSLQFLKDTSN